MIARAVVGVGLTLLVPSVIWLIGAVFGVLPTIEVAGSTGLRPIASLAVIGCLTAAIGCWRLETKNTNQSEEEP